MSDPVLCAFAFDGAGGVTTADAQALKTADGGFAWVHIDAADPGARPLLAETLALDPIAVDALLAADTRPRCEPRSAGVTLNLRGVNLNEGGDPEDMVALRMWIESQRLVTARLRRLRAVDDVRDALARGAGEARPGGLVAAVALRLADRMTPTIAALNEAIDDLEDRALDNATTSLRGDLAGLRRRAILLRRYMAPQRDALNRASLEQGAWLDDRDRGRLREAADAAARITEELEAVRERAAVVSEQIADARAEAMNRSMLVLSVAAAIFLPLGLIAGMMGMNVGGLPGVDVSWAFGAVTAVLIGLGAVGLWTFRKLGWV